MWQKLESVYYKISQKIVHSIYQEIPTYVKSNKPWGCEKYIESVFAKVQFLTKQLKAALTPN